MRVINLKRRGSALVEAAVILPVIMIITFGIIEVGWWTCVTHMVHNAAREGSRAAVRLENSNSEVEQAVMTTLTSSLEVSEEAVTIRISKLTSAGEEDYQVMSLDENEQGEAVRVTVTVQFSDIALPSNLLGLHSRNLASSAVMKRTE